MIKEEEEQDEILNRQPARSLKFDLAIIDDDSKKPSEWIPPNRIKQELAKKSNEELPTGGMAGIRNDRGKKHQDVDIKYDDAGMRQLAPVLLVADLLK